MSIMLEDRTAINDQISTLRERAQIESNLTTLGRNAGRFAGARMMLTEAEHRLREMDARAEALRFVGDVATLLERLTDRETAAASLQRAQADLADLSIPDEFKRRLRAHVAPITGLAGVLANSETYSHPFTKHEVPKLRRFIELEGEVQRLGSLMNSADGGAEAIYSRHPALRGVALDELRGMLG